MSRNWKKEIDEINNKIGSITELVTKKEYDPNTALGNMQTLLGAIRLYQEMMQFNNMQMNQQMQKVQGQLMDYNYRVQFIRNEEKEEEFQKWKVEEIDRIKKLQEEQTTPPATPTDDDNKDGATGGEGGEDKS